MRTRSVTVAPVRGSPAGAIGALFAIPASLAIGSTRRDRRTDEDRPACHAAYTSSSRRCRQRCALPQHDAAPLDRTSHQNTMPSEHYHARVHLIEMVNSYIAIG
jgi:hypothetical protein